MLPDFCKRVCQLAAFAFLTVHPNTPLRAEEITAARNASQKINLSLQQSTLLEAAAFSACLAMDGQNAKMLADRSIESHDRFTTALMGIRDGHEWLEVKSEHDPEILDHIEFLAASWGNYGAAVLQIAHADFSGIVMQQLIRDNPTLIRNLEKLVQLTMATYGEKAFDRKHRVAIQKAAEQRMYSQKILKDACYVYFDIGPAEARAELIAGIGKFERGFSILSEGEGDILPPPNTRISRNLRTAKLFWKKERELVDKILAGESLSEKDMRSLIKFNDSIVKQLNQAVEGYFVAS